uniref:Uncharacterized protein n=1 Tax=Arundo donax TaxID=35708 RepID=A0A0A9G8A0_ARUDO
MSVSCNTQWLSVSGSCPICYYNLFVISLVMINLVASSLAYPASL